MATITGVYGAVRTDDGIVSTVTNWTIDNSMEIQSYTASNTSGMAAKLPGLRSANGSFAGLGGIPPILPGEEFVFEGFTGGMNADGDMDPEADGNIYKVRALCTQATITLNYGTFEPINWQVTFNSNYHDTGDELIVTEGNFKDISIPTATVMDGSHTIIFSRAGTVLTGVCVSQATLTLTCATQQFSNSCTGGWQAAVPGAIDATLSVTVQESTMFLEPGDSYMTTIHTENTGTKPWIFTNFMCGSLSGLNIDISGGGVVEYSADLEFSAFTDNVKGSIIAPDGSTYWPKVTVPTAP
jgi:hypothetical protein